MASDLLETTLGEIVKLGNGLIQTGPFGSQLHASDYVIKGIPVIMPLNIIDNKVDLFGIARITKKDAERLSKHLVKKNDIVYSRRGDVTRKALITEREEGMFCGTGCLLVRPGHSIDARFLTYHLSSPINQEWIIRHAVGATMPNLNTGILKQVPLSLPSLDIQKAIAHILGSLDDKIGLNRQINETLEAMAQALFKSWFVDFDPVIDNALAAGNSIPDELLARAEQRQAMPPSDTDNPAIRALFSDAFEFTEEMGWIPKGWAVKSFGDLLDLTIGGDWGKPEQDEKHTVESVIIRGTDIPKLKIGERSEAPTRWVEEKKLKTRILRPFDIVIEISGGSPTQSTGRSIIITEQILERLGDIAEPASFCRKFSPKDKFLGLYAGVHLQKIYDDGKMWEYQNQSTGIANFQTTSFLEREQLVVPSESILLQFYKTIEPIFSKMSSNQQIELAKLRDTLLPKLLSGELRITDAAAMVEEA